MRACGAHVSVRVCVCVCVWGGGGIERGEKEEREDGVGKEGTCF